MSSFLPESEINTCQLKKQAKCQSWLKYIDLLLLIGLKRQYWLWRTNITYLIIVVNCKSITTYQKDSFNRNIKCFLNAYWGQVI
jgi:hypothetical protein